MSKKVRVKNVKVVSGKKGVSNDQGSRSGCPAVSSPGCR
jgi:hypothetical protein